jgi:Predicted membrane protein (DUF2207)
MDILTLLFWIIGIVLTIIILPLLLSWWNEFFNKTTQNAINLKNRIISPDSPEFDLNTIFPWDAQYIVNQGEVDFDNLILGYLFYIANKGYIEIFIVNGVIKYNILNPEIPIIYNFFDQNVTLQSSSYIELRSKLIPNKSQIIKNLDTKQHKYYTKAPNGEVGVFIMIGSIVVTFCLIVILGIMQNLQLLINFTFLYNLYLTLVVFWLVVPICFVFGTNIFSIFDKIVVMNKHGIDLRYRILAYKLYLDEAESERLNFENNLDNSNLQTYLKHLAYAAAFGILKKLK